MARTGTLALAAAALLLLAALPAASAAAGSRRLLRAPAAIVGNTPGAASTRRHLSQISANLKDDINKEANAVSVPKSQAPPGYMGKIMAPAPTPTPAPEAKSMPVKEAAAATTAATAATATPMMFGAGQQAPSMAGAGPVTAAPVAQRGPGDLPAGALGSASGVHSAGSAREAAFHDAHGNVVQGNARESAFAADATAAPQGLDAAPPKDAQVKWVQFGAYGQINEFTERPSTGAH